MSPRPLRRRLAPLLLLACAAPLAALDPSVRITQYVHDGWSGPRYLPHDDVSAIVQSSDGYLWIGTVEGLARFDGVRSVTFDRSNTPELADNWIKALLEDREGRLWIATYSGGLVSRQDGRFRRWGAAEGLPAVVLHALHEDHEGRLWVGAHDGLYRLEGERFVREPLGAAGSTAVLSVLEDRGGTLWAGTPVGLFRRDGGGWSHVEGLSNQVVNCLAENGEGLWIGTEKGGVNRLVDGRVTTLGVAQGLAHPRIWTLYVDRDDSLWIGTDGGGLQRLRQGRLESFSTANGLANDYVWALREDHEGSLWVGTNGGGLERLRNGRAVPWTTREGLPSDFVWAVLRTRSGDLFVGTEEAGLVRFAGGRFESHPVGDLEPESAKTLLERRDGSLWIGGHHGVWIWRDGEVVPAGFPGLEQDTINALAEDADGTLWIASNSTGAYSLRDGVLEPLAPALPTGAATALLVASDGALWIGTLGGVSRLTDSGLETWTRDSGLPADYVTDLFETRDGAVWAATRGGLARIRGGRVQAVTEAMGLRDGAVMSAQLDADGGLWLGGNRGLDRVVLAELEQALEGGRERVETLHLGTDDGLPSVEINGAGASSFLDRDGRVWFATRGGLAVVDPRRLDPNPQPPPVVIEEARADGAPLEAPGPWTLAPGLRRLEIHFTALSFASIPRVRILYRLEGFDRDWVEARADRTAEYTSLPHGRYRFRVVAANADGIWNRDGAEVGIVIRPRIWETLWFRTTAVVVFLLLGPLYYFYRVRMLRAQKVELERLVTERTGEVEAANVRLSQLAREDALTGVANRRTFDEALDEEWRRAARLRTTLALLMVDVDSFKAYNDSAGHLAGDASLKAIAQSLDRTFQRAGETVARYGGEEFAVLLPALSLEEARAAAEGARQRVLHLHLPHRSSKVASVVTVSIGVAWAAPSGPLPATGLVAAADQALYRAKQNGRNRVEIAPPVENG